MLHHSQSMAFLMLAPTPAHGSLFFSVSVSTPRIQRMAAINKPYEKAVKRRTANYQPDIWGYDFIQSLRIDYMGEKWRRRFHELKKDVKRMLFGKTGKPLEQLELVDILQRIGVSYHFEEEIQRILNSIFKDYPDDNKWKKENLHATALEFRLLRQHGYNIRQDVFNSFKDDMGNFKKCHFEDVKGVLSLYEASYICIEGESILEEVRKSAKKHLEKSLGQNINPNLATLVSHSLELPLHWRMLRLEARWFIDVYERRPDMNPVLLEFAKLDYNMLQTVHQEELKDVSRWWKRMGLGEKMSFTRDRLVENFLWAVGHTFEPQFGKCRQMVTKLISLITTIDDVYDVHGTLDELELFTAAVERWDINAMDELPEYLQICFLALVNSINEMAYDVLKEKGYRVIPYLRKMWADLCKCFLVEARWYHNGYTPTLEEYIKNGSTSSSVPVILGHLYFWVANPITKEAIEYLNKFPDVILGSSLILRLSDDLGTSSEELKRGDVPKSIQCYMRQRGASEEGAREHIKYLVGESWKKMNKERFLDSPFSHVFTGLAMNLGRMAQSAYLYGDGYAVQDGETKDDILRTLIQPIPLP